MKNRRLLEVIPRGLWIFLAVSFAVLLGSELSHATGEEVLFQTPLHLFFARDGVKLLLIIIAVVSLCLEIMIDTKGLLGLVSIISFVLFFYGGVMTGVVSAIFLVMFILGFLLLIIELFVPGFGLPGISGILFMTIGLSMSFGDPAKGIVFLAIALVISAILSFIIIKKGVRANRFEALVLSGNNNKKNNHYDVYVGQRGLSLTALRPAGIVMIGEKKIDCMTKGEFIPKDKMVEIYEVDGFKVFVREISGQNN